MPFYPFDSADRVETCVATKSAFLDSGDIFFQGGGIWIAATWLLLVPAFLILVGGSFRYLMWRGHNLVRLYVRWLKGGSGVP
ncbi:hypothetical protein MB02_06005 [Croceicoccus estronivorus]|uniref:hypothetical protein n=1 Tax=Croceicoccus estronivorus TaxID=1172626 RepID=UPI0008362098|nr:hypothetical protein [Croceicoccus estronivorus]OCC24990.1 hypothetical protein MB02_06005 [Croceicoccus estronivorus]